MKLSINNIQRGIRGSEGTWSKALVSVMGESSPADVVELRADEAAFDLMEKVFDQLKAQGMRLTVECDFKLAKVKGIEGVREETFPSKATGELVTQTALYLKLGANPHWAKETRTADVGNLADLLGEDMGDLEDLL